MRIANGSPVETVTVLRQSVSAMAGGASARSLASALARHESTAPFDLTSGERSVLLLDGSLYPLVPDAGSVPPVPLAAGETIDLSFSGEIPARSDTAFIVLVDAPTSTYLLAIPLR